MKKLDKVFKKCVRTFEENTMQMWGFTYKR